MKFTADASALKKAFNKILSAIPGKNIMPILECFLLDIKKDEMIITGTDLEKGVRCKVPVTADAEISLAVPGKLITDLVDKLEGSLSFDIELTKEKKPGKIDIHSSNGKYEISTSSAEDFPETHFDIKGKWFEIDAGLLHKAFRFTDVSISKEDIRPAMSGLLIQLEKGNINFVGTDGHKLSFFAVKDFDEAEGEFIMPREGMMLVKKIATGKVSFCPAASQIVFKSGEDLIWVRLIGDKYPKYQAVIPTDNNKFVEMDREKLQSVIKRLMLLETGIRTVPKAVFDFKKDECTVSLQCTESGNSGVEKFECKYPGEDLAIAFNARYLREILAVFDTEKILFSMNNPSKAIVIKENKGEENFILVMPVKIDG